MNLKNVDSRIEKLTVAESSADNYLNVTSRDSVALNVEVAGDAKVSLNIPMVELNITEAAKAARVDVLNAVDNMNVSGSNVKVEIAPIGNVAKANITGDKAEIGGMGVLTEAVILGKEVYVSTKGTSVEGENCYVEPVYQAPQVVVKNTYNNMTAGATTLTKNSNGTATISFSGQFKSAIFKVPSTVDASRIKSITLNVTVSAQIGIKVKTANGTDLTNNNFFPCSGVEAGTTMDINWASKPGVTDIATIELMSMQNVSPDLILNSVTFFLYEEGKVPTPTPTPTLPPLPPVEPRKVTLDLNTLEVKGATEDSVKHNEDGSVEITYEANYTGTNIAIPATYANLKYVEVSVSSTQGGEPITGQYGPEGNQIVLQSEAGDITTLYGGGVISYIVPDDVTLTSIVINSQKGKKDNPQVQTIHHIKLAAVVNLDLAKFNKGGAASVTTNDDGSITLEFGDAIYTGSNMPIPEEYKDCTYFEISAKSVAKADDTVQGTQIVFMDAAGKELKVTYAADWSNYTGSLELSSDQTLAKIVVNNQEPNVYLTVYYVKARY